MLPPRVLFVSAPCVSTESTLGYSCQIPSHPQVIPTFPVYSFRVLLAFPIGASLVQNMTGESQGLLFFQQKILTSFFFSLFYFIPLSRFFFCEKCSYFSSSYVFVLLLPARSLNFPCKSCESCCLQCISFLKVTLSQHAFSLSSL